MEKNTIFIAHNNQNFINEFQDVLNTKKTNYVINGYAKDGNQLTNRKNLDKDKIVIIKNEITQITGIYALEILLNNTTIKPEKIILLTAFNNKFVQYKCDCLGVDNIYSTTIDISTLVDLVCRHERFEGEKSRTKNSFNISREIIFYLKEVGLNRKYLGYTYMEYVLNYLFEKGNHLYKSMKEIYNITAKHFNVSANSVEKAMRTCIKLSFMKNDSTYARDLFGYNKNKGEFPSTSLFLQVSVKTLKEAKQKILDSIR